MAEDRKYFIFNKPMDYRRGTVDRMNAADGILRLTGADLFREAGAHPLVFLKSSGQQGRGDDLAPSENCMRGERRRMEHDSLQQ